MQLFLPLTVETIQAQLLAFINSNITVIIGAIALGAGISFVYVWFTNTIHRVPRDSFADWNDAWEDYKDGKL